MLIKLLFAGLLSFALGAAPAIACSSNSEYVAPSNFELVEIADAIGVYAPSRGLGVDAYSFGSVEFRLERAIHGTPPQTLTIDFAVLTERHALAMREGQLGNPFRFHDYGGGCSVNFNRGEPYLLILEQSREYGWQPVATGGSRAKELYDPGSGWARTVDRYLTVQRLDPSARGTALTAFEADNSLSAQERADIGNHLRTPSQWKPTSWLVDRYERAARGEAVDIVLSGPIQWRLGNDARATLLTSLARGSHPDAQPLFDRLSLAPDLAARERGLVLRYLVRNGQYQTVLRWREDRLLAALPELGERDAGKLLRGISDLQWGNAIDVGADRRRIDRRTAVAGRVLQERVERYVVESFGAEDTPQTP